MKLTFLGANHEVTGSCTLLETGGLHFLIDCGMEQGKDVYENQPLPVAPGEIDGVLLTHAHIDHSGHLPLLAKQGYRGKVYATPPTCRVARPLIPFSFLYSRLCCWVGRRPRSPPSNR